MKEEVDLENLLARSTPLPCSVDSMELMFAAGVEQQKKSSGKFRSLFVFVSVSSGFLLLSTLTLSVWLYGLQQENIALVAQLEQDLKAGTPRPENAGDRTGFERNDSVLVQKDHPAEEANGPSQPADLLDEKSENGGMLQIVKSTQNPQVKENGASGRGGLTSVTSLKSDYWLRGVALRPEDEYLNRTDGYVTRAAGNRRSKESNQSNLEMRNQLQGDFLGL